MNKTIYQRKAMIDKIVQTIITAKTKGKELDNDKLILYVIAETGLAKRTAREYVEAAHAMIEFKDFFDMNNDEQNNQ